MKKGHFLFFIFSTLFWTASSSYAAGKTTENEILKQEVGKFMDVATLQKNPNWANTNVDENPVEYNNLDQYSSTHNQPKQGRPLSEPEKNKKRQTLDQNASW